MIKCPACSANNNLQKFCGNCGSHLLADGVELHKIDIAIPVEPKREIKKSWLHKVFLFFQKLIIWIILFCLGIKLLFAGSFNLMTMFIDYLRIRKSYFFIVSLAVLFFL